MNLIESIREKAKSRQKTIVLPESADERILAASNKLLSENICKVILIGNRNKIFSLAKEYKISLNTEIQIIDPANNEFIDDFTVDLYERRKSRGLTLDEARTLVTSPLYFGAYLVKSGKADGCVAGAANTTGDVLKAAFHVIGMKPGSSVVSSVFLMSLKDDRTLTFGDCAVVPNPNSEQLASIAIDSSITHRQITGEMPRVAMLSFSTKGSAVHENVDVVVRATELARKLVPDLMIDGELQFDAAFVQEVASKKAPVSEVAGNANVYIFPNLDSGNIAYKVAERLAGVKATGPVIQGLNSPMNDLSRGCSIEDVVNTAAVTILQSE